MSLRQQPGQTPTIFKNSETEEKSVQLEVTGSMKLSSLNFGDSNHLDTSFNFKKKSNLNSTLETASISDSNSLRKSATETDNEISIISLNEVSWHDNINDCWLVIYDYVYNCTEFIRIHPGSQDVMLEYAGKDATLAFVGTGHSEHAKKLLKTFLIGELPVSERIFRIKNGIKISHFV